MRLGKLARDLDVKPVKIADFLRKELGKEIDLDPNYKIEEELVNKITDHFGVSEQEDDAVEKVHESKSGYKAEEEKVEGMNENEEVEESTGDLPAEPEVQIGDKIDLSKVKDDQKPEKKEQEVKKITLEEKANYEVDENAEVIRAPKVSIEGIKVLGKIDLPEPAIKEDGDVDGEEKELTPEQQERLARKQEREQKRKERQEREEKRRLEAFERKQKREAELKEKKRKEEETRLKEIKKSHYQEALEKSGNKKQKSKKKGKKKQVEKIDRYEMLLKEKEEQKSMSLLGKIWKWFNT